MKLLMLQGLPASGKSTFARKLASDGWTRVNKDDLRSMLHDSRWTKANEQQVLTLRDCIIEDALQRGRSVVVDDTNLSEKHRIRLKEIAAKYNAHFETKFFNTPVEECIKRDLARPNSVGPDVIWRMYNQFLKPKPEVYIPPDGKPEAILCDIDGTLAHMKDRGPFEWLKVGQDTVDHTVADILATYYKNSYKIILLSGRDAICFPQTTDWLARHNIEYDVLLMRQQGDNRKDFIIKRELFDTHIRENYRIKFVLDDRKQVIRMWQSLGLKVLCCANDIDDDF